MSFCYPFQLLERVCVFVPKLNVCAFMSVSLHPYVAQCDGKSVMFSVTFVHMYTALCACLYIHMCICQEGIDYIARG